jgi:hypothetical protein
MKIIAKEVLNLGINVFYALFPIIPITLASVQNACKG